MGNSIVRTSAIQIEVTINGYNVTIEKKNLVSLKVDRKIGDSANEFSLEAFDETAYNLERALIGTSLASITVRYCMANNMNNALCFSGTCIDYQITFTGRAVMLTITGILAATAELSAGYTFTKRAIEWCGSEPVAENGGTIGDASTTYSIDGKSQALWSQYENVNDVCAIVKLDENNNPVPYFNPTRIFNRIIHKYNNDTLGTSGETDNTGWGTGGSGYFKLAESKESRWVAGLSTCQESTQTTSQYITDILCKNAITYTNGKENDITGEISGYKYWVDGKGHHFMPLDYSSSSVKSKISVNYGMQDSNVISFSLSNVGAIAMCGIDTESRKKAQKTALINNSSLDYLYASTITSGSDNEETDSSYENWWNLSSKEIATTVKSSSSASALSTVTQTGFDGLESMIYSAELTIWGDMAKSYSPGDYIDIIVTVGKKNIRHYASGVYMILSISDSISQDGFTQSMKLLKNTSAISNVTTTKSSSSNSSSSSSDEGTTTYTSSTDTSTKIPVYRQNTTPLVTNVTAANAGGIGKAK